MAETSGWLPAGGWQVAKETLENSNLKRTNRGFPAAKLWLVCRMGESKKK